MMPHADDHVKRPRGLVAGSFQWFGRDRRLRKDYEEQPQSNEALVYITMIQVMLKRLEPAA
jgi:transposase